MAKKGPLDTTVDDGAKVDPAPSKQDRANDQEAVENKNPLDDIQDKVESDSDKRVDGDTKVTKE